MKIEDVLILPLGKPDIIGDIFDYAGTGVQTHAFVYDDISQNLTNLVCGAELSIDPDGVYADLNFASQEIAEKYLDWKASYMGQIIARNGKTITRCFIDSVLLISPINFVGTNISFTPLRYYLNAAADPNKPMCLKCECELSTYLDAYFGKDPYGTSLCSNCRWKAGIR